MTAVPTPPERPDGRPDLSRLRIADSEREPTARPRSWARALQVALAAVGAAAAAWLLRGPLEVADRSSESPTEAARLATEPSPSKTPPAAVAEHTGAVLAGGRVESSERRELAFAQAGIVGIVRVARGQGVKAGDVLVELDNKGEHADVAERRAALDVAMARLQELSEGARPEELEQAQRDLDAAQALAKDAEDKASQAEMLLQKGASTRGEQQAAARAAEAARARAQAAQARFVLVSRGARKTALSSAQGEVARMRAALAHAEARLEATRLVAPVDGTVVDVRVRTGEATGAVAQAPPAVVLSDLHRLEVKVDVPEAKATRVRVGDRATITVEALPETPFAGRVTDVGLEADRQKGTLEVTVAFDPNPSHASARAHVRPRMAARVSIDAGQGHDDNAIQERR